VREEGREGSQFVDPLTRCFVFAGIQNNYTAKFELLMVVLI
jgi:hypothetical protein